MGDCRQAVQLLSSFVYGHGKGTLGEFFRKSLQDKNKELHVFLKDEIHSLYHAYEIEDCCQCLGLGRRSNRKKTHIREEQWAHMYEIQREVCAHCKNQKRKKSICQFDVISNVTISSFDITLLTTLLLHFQKEFKVLDINIRHILCICSHRDWLAHDEHLTATVKTVRDKCNDLSVSIKELASACSTKFAAEKHEKMKIAKETYCNYTNIKTSFPSKAVDIFRKGNGKQIILETNPNDLQEDLKKLEEHFESLQHDDDTRTCIGNDIMRSFRENNITEAAYDLDVIRARLSIDEYKTRVIDDIDPVPVIECLHLSGHLTDTDRQSLLEKSPRRVCSESLIQTLLTKDETAISDFMKSLLDIGQRSTHNYILGNDHRGELQIIIKRDIPLQHPSGFDVVVKLEIDNRPDLQKIVLDVQDSEEKLANMNVHSKTEGSVIIHLKPSTPNALEDFKKAFYDGTLRTHIEDFLRRAGVLDELIKDNVKVTVNISMAGSEDAKVEKTMYDEHWDFLIEELSPKSVVDMLFEKGILDSNDVNDIFRIQTRFAQANTLLCKLKVKGSETFPEFKQCLAATHQNYVLAKLEEKDSVEKSVDNSEDKSHDIPEASGVIPTLEKTMTMEIEDDSSSSPNTILALSLPDTFSTRSEGEDARKDYAKEGDATSRDEMPTPGSFVDTAVSDPVRAEGGRKDEIRIILIGRTGCGKSSTGNTILDECDYFETGVSTESVTNQCKWGETTRFGKKLLVVDTPGLFDTRMTNKPVNTDVVKCMSFTSPGPHAFVLVVNAKRSTSEEARTVKTVKQFAEIFGERIYDYLIVLFTRAYDLGRGTISIDAYISEASEDLKQILRKCGQRYCEMNNTAPNEIKERNAKQLFDMIENMIRLNGESIYTMEMYTEAGLALERKLEAEKLQDKQRGREIDEMIRMKEWEKQKIQQEYLRVKQELEIQEELKRQEELNKQNLEMKIQQEAMRVTQEERAREEELYKRNQELRVQEEAMKTAQEKLKRQQEEHDRQQAELMARHARRRRRRDNCVIS